MICATVPVAKRPSRDEVNAALQQAADGELERVLGFEARPLVPVDFIGSPLSSIIDAAQAQFVDDDLAEVQSWHDNDGGFSNRMLDLANFAAQRG
jgi:glyceraldehyde 3-phosphate dehydrogenase